MTATLPEAPKRHEWTKAELQHLNRVASKSKRKMDAFKKVAAEMGLTQSAVSATYYAHHKTNKPAPMRTMKASKVISKPADRVAGDPSKASDLSKFSIVELGEMAHALRFEFARRKEAIAEMEEIFAR